MSALKDKSAMLKDKNRRKKGIDRKNKVGPIDEDFL